MEGNSEGSSIESRRELEQEAEFRIETRVLQVDPNAPDPARLAEAAEVLRSGGLVAFPTETVYGLGADALNAEAVAGIFRAKGRPANNPLIVHVADVEAARALVTVWPEIAERLAAHFWPGPLTLVLPCTAQIPSIVTAGGPTVGLRVPAHPVAQALLRAAQVPVAAPSANRSEQLSPVEAAHVLAGLGGRIAMVVDGGSVAGCINQDGQAAGGLESTVLDLTCTPPRLLRPGLLAPGEIEAVIGPLTRSEANNDCEAALPSPGMMKRHYAPHACLELLAAKDLWPRALQLAEAGRHVAVIYYAGPAPRGPTLYASLLLPRRLPDDPQGYASLLYATLHACDAQKFETILVQHPPEGDDWLAIRDRLHRAAVASGKE